MFGEHEVEMQLSSAHENHRPSPRRAFSVATEDETLLRTAVDQTWALLSPQQRAHTTKSELADQMLRFLAQGERDPVRLVALALMEQYKSVSSSTINLLLKLMLFIALGALLGCLVATVTTYRG
jgi:hypothetical protein